jgi:hypothetical protein
MDDRHGMRKRGGSMKYALFTLTVLIPLSASGQYIGNPGGKAIPLGAVPRGFRGAHGFAGIEGGYMDLDVDAEYRVQSGPVTGLLRETSNLEESFFAVVGGAHTHGFEFEARIGGSFQDLHEGSLTRDPYEDGGGILVGAGARWGFSPVRPLRFGVGGQFSYTYSEGDAVVSSGASVFRDDVLLELWRGQLFTGLGLDIPAGKEVTVSPYLGFALEFVDGQLEIEQWDSFFVYRERVGDFDEERIEVFFGGLDMHVTDEFRLGVEGRGNAAGWGAMASVGWRF